MTDQADAEGNAPTTGERLTLKGVVDEAAPRALRPAASSSARARRWSAASRQTMLVTRLVAAFSLVAVLVGWPLGKLFAHRVSTGRFDGWSYFGSLDIGAFLLGVFFPVLTILIGYVMSRLQQMMSAAEEIATTAREFIHPDEAAADNARSVGLAVRTQMDALNIGLDGALNRLASVEAMIRKHVQAIDAAGRTVETHASGAVSRVAEERVRLIELTENLNTQADAFARAIADKARAAIDALHSADDLAERAESQLEDRLSRLDGAAGQALESFNALSQALQSSHDSVSGVSLAIDAAARDARLASERAVKAGEAAAESAARNAANVGASAARAADEAKRAADTAIESSTREAERASRAAYEAAEREANRVAEVAGKLLGDVRKSTSDLINSVSADTDKAATFAARMADAAKQAVETSTKAAAELARAGEQARKDASDTQAAIEGAAARAEARAASLVAARAALEAENARLEGLIEEQRKRADRLADAIASQTDRLSKLAESQLREQETAARLAAEAADKMREEEAARAAAAADRRNADEAAAAQRADEARRAREESAQLNRDAAARAAETESRKRLEAEKPAPAKKQAPSLVERAMKSTARKSDGVLELGKTAQRETVTPDRQKAGSPENDAIKSAPDSADKAARREPPLTLSGEDAAAASGAARRDKHTVSWREILDATDEAAPLDLGAASRSADQGGPSIKIIGELQLFTLELETRLYGEPPPALRERFDRGDRNLFANRILRLNESDVKRRIRTEADRDRGFERDIQGFLQGFEKLLEDATTSRTADEDLEEYLSSPLGRVYLLIGAMVGYFA